MGRNLVTVWWTGVVVAFPALGAVRVAGGFPTPWSWALSALLTGSVGVVPAYVVGTRLFGTGGRPVPAPVAHVAASVLWSAVLSLGVSVVLFGLPHGGDTALSWHDIGLRTAWIAGVLVPVHLVTVLVRRVPTPLACRERAASGTGVDDGVGGRHR